MWFFLWKILRVFRFFFLVFFSSVCLIFCFHYLYIQLNNKNIINLFVIIFNFNTRVMSSLYESYDDEDGGVGGGGEGTDVVMCLNILMSYLIFFNIFFYVFFASSFSLIRLFCSVVMLFNFFCCWFCSISFRVFSLVNCIFFYYYVLIFCLWTIRLTYTHAHL